MKLALFVLFLTFGCVKASITYPPDAAQEMIAEVNNGLGGMITSLGGDTGSGGMDGVGGDIGTGGAAGNGIGGETGSGGDGMGGSNGGTGVSPSAPGDVVITEIMSDTSVATSDDFGEWFELFNPTTTVWDLFNCLIFDRQRQETISRSLLILPGEYISLGRFKLIADGGFIPTYSYISIKFSDAGDKTGITCGSTVIDIVDFTIGFPIIQGRSMSLDPTNYDPARNDTASSWCMGKDVYHNVGSGNDYGTPGAANPSCMP